MSKNDEIDLLGEVAKNKSTQQKTLNIIEGIVSRLKHALALEHALRVFAQGEVSEKLFLERIKDLTHSGKLSTLYKRECPGCHKYYWTIKPDQMYCSRACRKRVVRAADSMKRKVEKLMGGLA